MGEFWDARAREDPFYFVDNRLEYRSPDLDFFWSGGRELLDRVLDLLVARVHPGDDVVEVGCGVGRITRVLAERAATVSALDVSSRMLELARELNPGLANVEWVQGDGSSLAALEDSCADACVSLDVFQHMPDPAITLAYVREIGRVLRPGGWAAIQVSNSPDGHRPRSRAARLRGAIGALAGRAPRGQDGAQWRGSMTPLPELEAAAAAAGMSVERSIGHGTPFCFLLLRRG